VVGARVVRLKQTGPNDYVELHCHSCFSLLDGAALPELLAARAADLGLPALALTDHDELGGTVRFAQATREVGIEGIIGAEVTVGMRGAGCGVRNCKEERPASRIPRPTSRVPRPAQCATHLVLLAETREGYGNLSTLITRARMENSRGEPCVSLELLAEHADGLFALTGCPRGWVPSLVASGDLDGACEAAASLKDAFDGRMAIECWDHGLAEERETVRGLIEIARALDIPWVVTNDVHYARARDRIVHDVLSCLRHDKKLDEMGTRLRPNGEWYLKSAAQMRRRWQRAREGITATRAIAERCAFRMEQLEPTLPAFPLPPRVTADEYLERLVIQGAQERWREREASGDVFPTDTHRRQVEHELGMIRRLGLAGYFLIVWDIVRFARREGILCQGRGSAANSAVCYCLGITAVDPIRLGLLFERFLSEERREAPDIDIDFSHRERERVIQYVYGKYGREHAAMVCEQITYRGRSAVRDAARVLGFSVEQADRLATLSDRFSARATAKALRGESSGSEGTEEREETAEEVIARAFGQQMIPGTTATTQSREVKEEAKRAIREKVEGRSDERATPDKLLASAASEKRLTASDRPRPNAGYEPYGSTTGHETQQQNRRWAESPPVDARPDYMDPYATETHNERRNPTTAITTSAADRRSPLVHAGLDPSDKRVRALAEIVDGLNQIPRHRSIHVGGFVLTAEPLSTVVPIEPASMEDRTVIQWEKDDLDPVGLVKIDLLGLGMLTLIQDCLLYIRQTRGITVDLAQLDMDDSAVYDDLCRADTIGVFQVESRAQMNTLPRLKPRCFYDLVVEVAIIRPGPIQGDMVHPYLRRRAGEEPVTYPHPALEPILKRTLGVPLFQEQGMQVAIACAGFTPGESDMLRRAMGHKRSRERMAAICQKLVEGMKANGIAEETAMRIYNQINAFADYGFPESHAASFALLVYASAYLKHYYAPEFTAAILNAQPMGFYAPGTLIEDARRHGVKVLPVDARRSRWDATLERASTADTPPAAAPAVRLGVRSVRGLGPKAKEIFEGALAAGAFQSIEDFVQRTPFDQRTLRHLAEAGAFDSFVPDEPDLRRRRAALWEVLDAVRGDAGPLAPQRAAARRASAAGQAVLPAMSPGELTEADYRMTGISLNGHPMSHLRPHLAPNGIRTARELTTAGKDGERIAGAGLVICRQRPGTAKGFVFLTLEDETGTVNVVVTPKRFERQALLISTTPLLLVRGTLQVEQGVVNVRGEEFRGLTAEVGAEYAQRHDFH
jgi:error-prone DNA polymerase